MSSLLNPCQRQIETRRSFCAHSKIVFLHLHVFIKSASLSRPFLAPWYLETKIIICNAGGPSLARF